MGILCGLAAIAGRFCWNSIAYVSAPSNRANKPHRIRGQTSSKAASASVVELKKQTVKDDAFDLSQYLDGVTADGSDGSLVHFADTYRIVRKGDRIPKGAKVSSDRVEPLPSEYGD